MIDADATSWCFSGNSDLHETGGGTSNATVADTFFAPTRTPEASVT
jgi:hypothetical protein